MTTGKDRMIDEDILRILPDIAEEPDIRGAKVFITGGTGFVGFWLLKTLLTLNRARGWDLDIMLLSRSPQRFMAKYPALSAEVSFIQGDIVDFRYPEGNYRFVIHAATETSAQANASLPLDLFDSIVLGTRHVADFARVCGCRKFLYVSSGAVYGVQPSHMSHISESYMGAPDTMQPFGNALYGEAKRAGELIASLYAKEYAFEAKIARLFAFVGPYLPLDAHFAVGNFIRDVLEGRTITIGGDGTPYRSYMYAADMALWLLNILFKGKGGNAYNVGSDVAVTIAELAQSVAAAKRHSDICVMQKPGSTPAHRYVPSIGKARLELGLNLHYCLREAIERTIEWHECIAETIV